MQKKRIIVALTAAVALPMPALADAADMLVYGIANMSLDATRNGSTATTQSSRANKISSNGSRLGFKGTEILGYGFTALWQIEGRVDMDGAGGTLATRNTFVGVRDESWGQLILGRHDTPYKLATRRLDVFSDSMGDNRSLMGSTARGKNSALQFDSRPNNVIMYTSPIMRGVTVQAAYIAGAETAAATDIKGQTLSLAGLYENRGWFASLAYQVNDIGSLGTGSNAGTNALGTAGVKEKAWKAGVGYKLEQFEIGVAYEKTSDDIGTAGSVYTCTSTSSTTDCYGHKAATISGKYKLADGAVKLAYTKAGDLGDVPSSGGRLIAVGYDHSLSNHTTLYAVYARLSNDANATYALAGDAGTSTGYVNPAGAGADPSAISLGMKHTF